MTMLTLRAKGYDIMRYATKGGKSFEYTITDPEEWGISKNLIENHPPGATWIVLCYLHSSHHKGQFKDRREWKKLCTGILNGIG